MDASSPLFDFGQLYQLIFGYLTLSLSDTTNFLTENFMEGYNQRIEKNEKKREPVSNKSFIVPTMISGLLLGGLMLLKQRKD